MEFSELHNYIIDSFRNTTDDIEEINNIPHFPAWEGEHHTEIIDNDETYIEIITNTAFLNHILFKVRIDTTWIFQEPKVYNFLCCFFNTYRNRRIISTRFYKIVDNNPYNCWVYFMIEFAP